MESARARHPEIFGRFQNTSWDAVPEAENSVSMYARAVESWTAMRELASRGAKNIVCVSHGGLIQWLIRSTFGARTWLPLIPAANCGISRYDVEVLGRGRSAFVQWGLISYKAPASPESAKPVF
jgi:broad specificity phosphatase PhoE